MLRLLSLILEYPNILMVPNFSKELLIIVDFRFRSHTTLMQQSPGL